MIGIRRYQLIYHGEDGRITFSHGWEINSHWLAEQIINKLLLHKLEARR